MYLYFFERIVRAAVADAGGPADFAIPYWNYDLAYPGNTIPKAFRTPSLPDGTANPLFLPAPRRTAGLMSGGQLDKSITSPAHALSEMNFTTPITGFGGGKVGPQHFGNFADTGYGRARVDSAQRDPCRDRRQARRSLPGWPDGRSELRSTRSDLLAAPREHRPSVERLDRIWRRSWRPVGGLVEQRSVRLP
jgi:hypothetical protein